MAEKRNGSGLKLRRIRSHHWAAFRSGEWAEILTTAPDPEGRDCYVVRFPDGVTDFWVVRDPDAQYEFICECGYDHEDYCGGIDICRKADR